MGGEYGGYLDAGHWEVSASYRYLHSDEVFLGRVYQPQYQATNGNPDITVHSFEFSGTYAFTKRLSATLAVPVVDGIVDVVSNRIHQATWGVGDVRLIGTAWVLDPSSHPGGNVAMSLGVKFPTGESNAKDPALIKGSWQSRPVDPAIQPGDGGWGLQFEMNAFMKISDRASAYVGGSYLLNPRGKSDTEFTTDPTVKLSVPDYYSGRAGVTYALWPKHGLSLSLGGRVEGVPVRDLVGGGDDGFRRPGYAVYVEPGLGWSWSKNHLFLSVPVAVERNRERSIRDLQGGVSGVGGVASYFVLLGYTHRF